MAKATEWSVSVVERGAIRGCEYTTGCLAAMGTSARPKYKEPEIESGTLHSINWKMRYGTGTN